MPDKKLTKRWIKTAADQRAFDEGCYFDPKGGEKVIEFFEKCLRHSKGEWAGKVFHLADWESQEIIMPLFSWHNPDGFRRYRSGDIWVPKKNGKSTIAAGLTLYMLVADGESGAEVYSAANDREQAAIIFRECEAMVLQSPALIRRLNIIKSQKRITYETKFSFYKALSADVATKEGLNPHFVVVDEIHAMKTR
jgi:phage terminase large subunit-like protein